MDGFPAKTPQPKSEGVTPKSSNVRAAFSELSRYIDFLACLGELKDATTYFDSTAESPVYDMAAIFDRSNPASPLAYDASQTALLLMDFQGFIVEMVGLAGMAAMAKAKAMRDWAFEHGVMVIHSVVDVKGAPPDTCKSNERIQKMLDSIANDKDAAEEPTEISFGKKDGEYIVLKSPGNVSALKSAGAMELLAEHGIKSLILCGISTSGCVLRTAVPATDDGFIVSVIEDACCDPKETVNEVLMKIVLPSRAHIAPAEEFMKEWARAGT